MPRYVNKSTLAYIAGLEVVPQVHLSKVSTHLQPGGQKEEATNILDTQQKHSQ